VVNDKSKQRMKRNTDLFPAPSDERLAQAATSGRERPVQDARTGPVPRGGGYLSEIAGIETRPKRVGPQESDVLSGAIRWKVAKRSGSFSAHSGARCTRSG